MGSPAPKRHVVVIGAGAAGMACADTLAQHPEKFKVTLLERGPVCGGQATSIGLDEKRFGANWMNNGVQGGSPIFKHSFKYFKKYKHEPQEVGLQVSFGKGPDGFWTNVFPTSLVEQFTSDIKKFGYFLKIIKWTMPVLGLVPLRIMLRLMMFSKDFGDKMVYPLVALFLGTGNQTPNVPSAIVEQLFDDPNMKLWDYDPETLLPNLPQMFTFNNLNGFYQAWREDLERRGVKVRLQTAVSEVTSRTSKGILIKTRKVDKDGNQRGDAQREVFDEMVMCVLADDALKILGSKASAREKFVLGGAKFYDDITITHCDSEYFKKHYETAFDPALSADPKSEQQKDKLAFARGEDPEQPGGFRPMYYTKSYKKDMKKIEMSFDCSNYQFQLLQATGPNDERGLEHVYQSIFLDSNNRDLWTWHEIDESKIIQRKWWHQLGHRWQHYLRVVPLMMFVNGKNHTWFAGSWTMVNMHELACVSGIAAAYRLGAEYRKFDDFAEDFFSKYLMPSHGVIYSREEKRRQKQRSA